MSSAEDERRIGLLLPDFTGISTFQTVWDWIDACIVPSFAVPEPRILMSNHLLGKVRLRQLRVREGTCIMQEVSYRIMEPGKLDGTITQFVKNDRGFD